MVSTAPETLRFITPQAHPEIAQQAIAEGYSPFQAAIIARRLNPSLVTQTGSVAAAVAPSLRHLTPPDELPDIGRAAARIADAIERGEHVASASDHDADGISASAVIVEALTQHLGAKPENVHSFNTERLTEGYGLSAAFVQRVLHHPIKPTLLITADQGSSDTDQISVLAHAGIDVVVTDHHLLPVQGPPRDAYACVNPVRTDSRFGDKNIAGVHVAWLVMCATRRELIKRGALSDRSPSLAGLLDVCALGTTADAVSFGNSLSNRAIAVYGVARMNAGARPCWDSLRRVSLKGRESTQPITTRDLGYGFGARVNSGGRLGEATPGVNLLLARDTATADHWANDLDERNAQRRGIQDGLMDEASIQAQAQVDTGCRAIAIAFEAGHSGVHGIVASRLVQTHGRPVACLSPKTSNPSLLSASFRSIAGFHMRDALQTIHDELAPHCLVAYGGHFMAAGATVVAEQLPQFLAAFETVAQRMIGPADIGPRIIVDGLLTDAPTLDLLDDIDAIGPFGRGYDEPVFQVDARIIKAKVMGDGTHVKLDVVTDTGHTIAVVWFNARPIEESGQPFTHPARARMAISLRRNEYRGKLTPQAILAGMVPLN